MEDGMWQPVAALQHHGHLHTLCTAMRQHRRYAARPQLLQRAMPGQADALQCHTTTPNAHTAIFLPTHLLQRRHARGWGQAEELVDHKEAGEGDKAVARGGGLQGTHRGGAAAAAGSALAGGAKERFSLEVVGCQAGAVQAAA